MTISVVIPAYNEEKYIGATLESILQSRPENLLEIIVVNNASKDRTAEIASSYQGVTVVHEPQKGLTKARQKGLESASGDLLAFIDADTQTTAEWFKIVNEEFARDPSLVCLSGPYHYFDLPKWQQLVVHIYYGVLARMMYGLTDYMVTGGNFVAKRSALQKIGFDSKIQFYGEDTDIARRLHDIGKVKFMSRFVISTSGRRMQAEGLIRTGLRYGINYASIVFLKRPISEKYKDVR